METPVPESRLDRLMVLRTRIEASFASAPVRDFAALSREYRAVLAEIAELAPSEQEGDALDEIAARRVARRAGSAKGSPRAKRSG